MIEKMKFVSISGPKNDLDRMVNQYLSHYEIQLENALTELRSASKLEPYPGTNTGNRFRKRRNFSLPVPAQNSRRFPPEQCPWRTPSHL